MRNVGGIIFWVLLVLGLCLSLGFVETQSRQRVCDTLVVQVDFDNNKRFVSTEEVSEMVVQTEDSLFVRPAEEINIGLLEEKLSAHPAIYNTEVYSTINGELRVSVIQREPWVRVMGSGKSYYIDRQGEKMPLSAAFTARVPIVYHDLDSLQRMELVSLLSGLRSKEFWNSGVSGFKWDDEKAWMLQMRWGPEWVVLGPIDGWEEKLNKGKVFFQKALPAKGINAYKSIDLRFKDQVVATKK